MNVHDAPAIDLPAHDQRPASQLARSADEKGNDRDVSIDLQAQVDRNEWRRERWLRRAGPWMGVCEPATKHRLDRGSASALRRERPVKEHRYVVGERRAERVEVSRVERREVAVKKYAKVGGTVAIRRSRTNCAVRGGR